MDSRDRVSLEARLLAAALLVLGGLRSVQAQESVTHLVQALEAAGESDAGPEGIRGRGDSISDAMLGLKGSEVAAAVAAPSDALSRPSRAADPVNASAHAFLRIAAPPSPGEMGRIEVPGDDGAAPGATDPGAKKPSRINEMLDRFALRVTATVNVKFFVSTALVSALWIGWNMVAPPGLQFDPAPNFQFWLFCSNFIQLLLMPLILVGQNLQGRFAEQRAKADYEHNLRALRLVERLEALEADAAAANNRTLDRLRRFKEVVQSDSLNNEETRRLLEDLAREVEAYKAERGPAASARGDASEVIP